MAKKSVSIQNLIYEIRDQQVMLDEDLAKIYQVETKVLNRAVKRNIARFPPQFMFQLTKSEYENLKCQIGTSSLKPQIAASSWGGRRKLPYAFTEHGVIMLSSVLNSKIATQININVVKAFIDMRHYIAKPIREKLDNLENILMLHIENSDIKFTEHGEAIKQIFQVLNNLLEKPKEAKRIGFKPD
jgi:hypothetical protein